MYTIGIDLGTTNTKAIAVTGTDRVFFERSFPTKVKSVPTGGEMDPKELAEGVLSLLKDVIPEVQRVTDEPLYGISLTGMAEAGFLADLNGEPLTPILLWYDQRGGAEADSLRPEYEDELTSVSGIRMSNVATIYKLCALKKELPVISGRVHRWFGVPEWAAWTLSGAYFTDRTLTVRTGAYSLKNDDWSANVLKITGLDRELFPQIIPAENQCAHLAPSAAEYLGVAESVRVMIAGHDDLAAAYGAGLASGVWVDSTGTAEGLIALTSPLPDARQTVRARMSIAPWYSRDAWALVAGIGTSGSLLAELSRQTGLNFDEIDRFAEKREKYPENALVSELTPQRLARVSFADDLTAAQKVSAVYDKILENFSARSQQILRFAPKPERLVITGGLALLPELSRRKSEILGGIPIESRPKPEAAAFGAAKLLLSMN